jgi:hypothetical protein
LRSELWTLCELWLSTFIIVPVAETIHITLGPSYLQGRKQLGVTESDSISNIQWVQLRNCITHFQQSCLRFSKLLESWHDNLPTQIRVPSQSGAPALPHVVTLNIKYWWLLILLHRPFSLRTQSTFKVSGKSNPTTFADLSVDVCEKAAESIVQLVVIFSHNYGSRFFPLYMLQVSALLVFSKFQTLTIRILRLYL